MEKLRSFAFISVARGSGFALLAIFCVMAGAAFDVAVSFFAGGILSLITSLILCLKALKALATPYKRTELWLMLEPEDRPHAKVAQRIIGTVLESLFYRFATNFALLAVILFAASFLMQQAH